jgi:predicted transcriptional regulator YdeE
LPNSKYERRFAPEFETYIENSRSFKEKIFIPIQKRSD